MGLCKADFSSDTAPLVRLMEEQRDSLYGLVNSASLFFAGNLLKADSFAQQLEINALVPLQLTQHFSSLVASGVVVNILDGNIERVHRSFQSYRTSKIILRELTRQLAVACAPAVRVNGLAPGTVIPPVGGADQSYKSAEELALIGEPIALEEVLDGLLFLLQNRSVTGEILTVDGGVHCL